MSMSSSSSLPLPQPQQPSLVDPNTGIVQPAAVSSSSHHSNGSFGSVFIVLAVIIVISAIACCLGRLCGRRHYRSHNKEKKPSKQIRSKGKPVKDLDFESPKKNQSFRPRERENGDLEFGFDKNIAASKPAGNNGETRSFNQFGNGDIRFEPKF